MGATFIQTTTCFVLYHKLTRRAGPKQVGLEQAGPEEAELPLLKLLLTIHASQANYHLQEHTGPFMRTQP